MENKLKLEEMPIEDLIPAEYNPRQMSEAEFHKLVKGLQKFGMLEPIVINHDNTVIGGHKRLKAAKHLEWETAPAVRVNLDKMQEKALNLALNRISGEWDYTKLTSLLSEFEADPEFDIEFTGFDTIEAADLTTLSDVSRSDALDDGLDRLGLSGSDDGQDNSPRKNPIIQYNIIFGDEAEQAKWHEYLKWLKTKYAETETIAQRIIADVSDRMANG